MKRAIFAALGIAVILPMLQQSTSINAGGINSVDFKFNLPNKSSSKIVNYSVTLNDNGKELSGYTIKIPEQPNAVIGEKSINFLSEGYYTVLLEIEGYSISKNIFIGDKIYYNVNMHYPILVTYASADKAPQVIYNNRVEYSNDIKGVYLINPTKETKTLIATNDTHNNCLVSNNCKITSYTITER